MRHHTEPKKEQWIELQEISENTHLIQKEGHGERHIPNDKRGERLKDISDDEEEGKQTQINCEQSLSIKQPSNPKSKSNEKLSKKQKKNKDSDNNKTVNIPKNSIVSQPNVKQQPKVQNKKMNSPSLWSHQTPLMQQYYPNGQQNTQQYSQQHISVINLHSNHGAYTSGGYFGQFPNNQGFFPQAPQNYAPSGFYNPQVIPQPPIAHKTTNRPPMTNMSCSFCRQFQSVPQDTRSFLCGVCQKQNIPQPTWGRICCGGCQQVGYYPLGIHTVACGICGCVNRV